MLRWMGLIGVCWVIFMGSFLAHAAPQSLGKTKDWDAFTDQENNQMMCYMVTKPITSEGDYTQRGPVWMYITHRPSAKEFYRISIVAGYRYDQGCDRSQDAACHVEMKIGQKKFQLYTDQDSAWAYPKDLTPIIQALKQGQTIVITGKSSKGTQTVDTFSLSGFTTVLTKANKACDVK